MGLVQGLKAADEAVASGHIEDALSIYADLRVQHPDHPVAYQRAAQVLVSARRIAEAEALLQIAVERFPDDVGTAVDFARLPMFARDWPTAFERWTMVQARCPHIPAGFAGAATALRELARAAEAQLTVDDALSRFPTDADLLIEAGILANDRNAWEEAAARWEAVRRHAPNRLHGYTVGARVAQELGQLEEAERLLAEAVERFPQETMPWMDRARLADKRALWDEAHEHWSNVQALQPSSLEAPIGRAAALRRLRRFEEAEVLIKAAMARLPDEPLLSEEYALIASAREDWSEALRRLLNARRRFPSVNAFRQRIFETKLRIAEIDPINVPDREENDVGGAASDRVRELVMRFESLGGTGHGCEFGIFQRHFGAEPLGLLRWADLLPEQLMAALETEFEGVGTAEQTVLFVPDHGGRPEYWTSDRKFHMAMRSFVFPDEIPHDRMFQQVTRRLQFLRSKLIDDLRAGDKIFVYKNMQRNLTAAEVTRLHEAVRRYGNNMLLYAQYADADHPFGTVEVNAPGLMIGYIDRFTHHPETNEYLGPSAEGFRRVCEEAVSLWTRATEGEIVCR